MGNGLSLTEWGQAVDAALRPIRIKLSKLFDSCDLVSTFHVYDIEQVSDWDLQRFYEIVFNLWGS